MQEWESNAGGAPVMKYARRLMEDAYLEAAVADDFIGVQTYTRIRLELPRAAGVFANLALGVPQIEKLVVDRFAAWQRDAGSGVSKEASARRTQMGYEFRPAGCGRHGSTGRAAPARQADRRDRTRHRHCRRRRASRVHHRRSPVAPPGHRGRNPAPGYIHWSAFDNFEWASGYAMQFGLIAVDRATQERTVKPSGRFLGEISRANRLRLPG